MTIFHIQMSLRINDDTTSADAPYTFLADALAFRGIAPVGRNVVYDGGVIYSLRVGEENFK